MLHSSPSKHVKKANYLLDAAKVFLGCELHLAKTNSHSAFINKCYRLTRLAPATFTLKI